MRKVLRFVVRALLFVYAMLTAFMLLIGMPVLNWFSEYSTQTQERLWFFGFMVFMLSSVLFMVYSNRIKS